ncbi:MAG TPA: sigma-54 dependent transcriptional regulator [Terracidiphilus sp.]|jgi:DNA-binding NtrC family response regulator|nr:sigma-54 dependent transcriptional regulator [Terracidiphilus sp.]HEX4283980.1 sigma-54 dependent transcriptional regulator [Terracidiphilus sp.]
MIRIGLLSEDRALQTLLASALGKEFQVALATGETEMLHLVDAGEIDVLMLDLNSNNGSMKERVESSRRIIAQQIPAVVMADDGVRATAVELVRLGAYGYCRRPPSIRELKAMLCRASENSLLKRQLQTVQPRVDSATHCDRLIGSSSAIRQVYHLVQRVANLNASVLVTGESGTGKELIARAIHNLGTRSSKPFVAVSCGAIPETLIEAELFGHEKGAFTGTVGAREGYFEQARDGTLFLDEIGDLSLYTQVKLLRVLQQMEFSRLGSSKLIPLKARLVFATHQDLGKLVAEGKFRQDLFYRINVMRIVSPALADHAEDIPQIADHYLKHYSELFQKPMQSITADAIAMLQNYPWPGNVRELENTIQRAIILAPGMTIRPEDLPLTMHADKIIDIGEYNPDCTFERQLRDYKIKLAIDAVRDNNGNKTLAARSLGISRAYLHRLIRLAEPDAVFEQDEGSASASA